MENPKVTVIGLGALGTILTKALIKQGFQVKSIFNRTPQKAETMAREFKVTISGGFPSKINELGDFVFITVPDRAIKAVVDQLQDMYTDMSGHTFVHCSGNESAELLSPLREAGGRIASFHPLQTFAASSAINDFKGIFFSLQGDRSVFGFLKEVAQKLGAQTMVVSPDQKAHLHAAGVIASNYLYSLLQASVATAQISGLSPEDVKRALLPLVKTTLNNAEESSFEEALSGPIKRGDIATVKTHLNLLENNAELLEVYTILGKRTVDMAKQSGHIDNDTASSLYHILS